MTASLSLHSACACALTRRWPGPTFPPAAPRCSNACPPHRSRQRELQHLRAALTRMPRNLALATLLAQRCIEQARATAIRATSAMPRPRWRHGGKSSRAARRRCWCCARRCARAPTSSPRRWPTSTRCWRATPATAQAWLTRATVQMVTGDFAAARASCMRLYSRAPPLVVQTCLSSVGSVSGQGGQLRPNCCAALCGARRHPGVRAWDRPCWPKWPRGWAAMPRGRSGISTRGAGGRRARQLPARRLPTSCSTRPSAGSRAPAEGQDRGRRAAAALRDRAEGERRRTARASAELRRASTPPCCAATACTSASRRASNWSCAAIRRPPCAWRS
jgi:hypothetical protein